MNNTNAAAWGLSERDMVTLVTILRQYPSVKEVWIFGSRAKGNFTFASDIDLAIMNDEVTAETISKIKADFEESSLPYFVDLVSFPQLDHPDLKSHILTKGQSFFVKS